MAKKLHGPNFPGKEHAQISISTKQKLHTEWVQPMAMKELKKFQVEKSVTLEIYCTKATCVLCIFQGQKERLPTANTINPWNICTQSLKHHTQNN